MNITEELISRSGNKCELCSAAESLHNLRLKPSLIDSAETNLLVCKTCKNQIDDPKTMDANHWRCLNDSMWSEHKAVQIIAWRMLNRLKGEGWPQDLIDMIYLEAEDLRFAEASGDHLSDDEKIIHKDAHGAILENGDTITLVKDLEVKGGGNFTAKRGTAVRNISLVHDNPEHIEGRVEGTHIVILTKFVKKTNAPQQS
ncbi:MAG: PhnA domain-containing protein [Wenyingzhuangia sp.]|jgi:protein PhnA|uniref:PhnA domain-containing protein n=1 Tax=Wenyingzhuangia sp. TaxID=1964193 RepID=UPI00321AD6AA